MDDGCGVHERAATFVDVARETGYGLAACPGLQLLGSVTLLKRNQLHAFDVGERR